MGANIAPDGTALGWPVLVSELFQKYGLTPEPYLVARFVREFRDVHFYAGGTPMCAYVQFHAGHSLADCAQWFEIERARRILESL
jgi:hypothetical protein